MQEREAPWYANGLAFTCARCGNCCTGAPGYVWMSLEEIEKMAGGLGLGLDDFARKYVRQVGGRYSLVERSNGECIFWDASSGCTVYEVRPAQCRTWPFWPEHLKAPAAWLRVQEICPGARAGRVYSIEEIEASARSAARALRGEQAEEIHSLALRDCIDGDCK